MAFIMQGCVAYDDYYGQERFNGDGYYYGSPGYYRGYPDYYCFVAGTTGANITRDMVSIKDSKDMKDEEGN